MRSRWWSLLLIAALVQYCLVAFVTGSHYRYGIISWRHRNGRKIRVFWRMAWRYTAFSGLPAPGGTITRSFGNMYMGDGGSHSTSGATLTTRNTNENWFDCEGTFDYTYPSTSNGGSRYQVYWSSCCRIGSLLNNANGGQRMSSSVDLRRYAAQHRVNSSPVSSMLPIVEVAEGRLNEFDLSATDDDMDPLSFRLATGSETGSNDGPPPNFDVDPNSGRISFNVPNGLGLWMTQIIVEDPYSHISVDFIMKVVRPRKICSGCTSYCGRVCSGSCSGGCVCRDNSPPIFISPSPWIAGSLPSCFIPGVTSTFTVTSADYKEPCDSIEVIAAGLPGSATFNKISGSNPVNYRFSWRPAMSDAGTHRVSFKAADSPDGVSLPSSVELYVPANQALPTISSLDPPTGDVNSAITVNVRGSGFLLGTGLYCRARLVGQSNFQMERAVYLSSSEVICVIPARADMPGAGSTTQMRVELQVSNLASCDAWRSVTSSFTYFKTCPEGSFASGASCNECPAGRYLAAGGSSATSPDDCPLCPAGRYGSSPGITSSQCTGSCAAGYYCPPGSTSRTQSKCPAGTYGSTQGLGDSSCSGQCNSGYFCPVGSTSPQQRMCSAGRYGSGGSTSSSCSGECSAGYYCPAASGSSTQNQCGSAAYYCPEGSGSRTGVDTGYYSVGGSNSRTRTSQRQCEAGYYCQSGIRYPCPAGRYSSAGGTSSSSCEGPCEAGFYCPSGSTSSTAESCAPSGVSDPATYYCPTGTTERKRVPDGSFSTDESNPPDQRTGVSECNSDEICVDGVRSPKIEWSTGCAGGSGTSGWRAGFVVDENKESYSIGSVKAVSNQAGSTVSYSVQSVTPLTGTGQHDSSGVPDWYPFYIPNTPFSWSTSAGKLDLKTSDPLNFEASPQYRIVVHASAAGYTTECQITVNVTNLNECPVWRTSTIQNDVIEESARATRIGGELITTELFDEDTLSRSSGQEILFTPVSVNPPAHQSYFTIGSCSGQISVSAQGSGQIDYELGPATSNNHGYDIVIRATDNAASECHANVNVRVDIIDKNESPYFPTPPSNQLFAIYENVTAGTPLLSGNGRQTAVEAADPDEDGSPLSSNVLSYRIISQDGDPSGTGSGGYFEIDTDTGELFVASGAPRISYENTASRQLAVTVRVTDGFIAIDGDFNIQIISVNLYPSLYASEDTFDVDELSSAGTVVASLSGTDEDVGTTFTWAIRSSTIVYGDGVGSPPSTLPAFPFELVSTGAMTANLVVTSDGPTAIDYENVAEYSFWIEVNDGGLPGSNDWPALRDVMRIVVKVNDINEDPIFASQERHIDENVEAPAAVGTSLIASDPDVGPGSVSQDTFDAYPPQTLTFSIAGWSSGFSLPSHIADYYGTSNANDLFEIDVFSGQITAKVSFDYEALDEYLVQITVTDNGSPAISTSATVVVCIDDINEPPVLISGQVLEIDENTVTTVSLTPVNVDTNSVSGPRNPLIAFDQDDGDISSLKFEFVNTSMGQDVFALANDGTLTVKSGLSSGEAGTGRGASLDYENISSYQLYVKVTDSGDLSDDGFVTVNLVNVNEKPAFPSYEATDESNPPVYESSVGGLTLAGTDFDFLKGEDVDSGDTGQLIFTRGSTSPNNCTEFFDIDVSTPGSAVLKVSDSQRLPALSPWFEACDIEVKVTDAEGLESDWGIVAITIVEQNFPPRIPTHEISIPEDTALFSQLISTLDGSDLDPLQTLTYSIRSVTPAESSLGSSMSMFTVDWPSDVTPVRNNAPLYLRDKALDFETVSKYEITIQIRDDGPGSLRSSNITVVNILDVNEPPEITNAADAMPILENSPADTTVGTVQVWDQDAGESFHFEIRPSEPSADRLSGDNIEFPFEIDATTGVIKVKQGLNTAQSKRSLDHETFSQYEVEVTVTDNGLPIHPVLNIAQPYNNTQIFTIPLIDVNEPPHASYVAPNPDDPVVISESSNIGTSVGFVSVFDEDDPNSEYGWGTLTWSIASGNDGDAFEVVADTGELRLAKQLDFETQTEYTLRVHVVDHDSRDNEPLSDEIDVTVFVRNEVDARISEVTVLSTGNTILETSGGQTLQFLGENLGYMPSHPKFNEGRVRVFGYGSTESGISPSGKVHDVQIPQNSSLAGPDRDVRSQLTVSRLEYELECTQPSVTNNSVIHCTSDQGAGPYMVWSVRVDYGSYGGSHEGHAFELYESSLLTKYRTPSIESMQNDEDMHTQGGQVVNLIGKNFGPAGTQIDVQYGVQSVEGGAVNWIYTAVMCRNSPSNPHTQVLCETVPGTGGDIVWRVTVSSQASSVFRREPTASYYGIPELTSVTVHSEIASDLLPAASGADPYDSGSNGDTYLSGTYMHTKGGEIVVIEGQNFGDDISAIQVTYGPLLSTDGTLGTALGLPKPGAGDRYEAPAALDSTLANNLTLNAMSYVATNCEFITTHTSLRCQTVAGVGAALTWRVQARNRISDIVVGASVTTHYVRPVVLAINGDGAWNTDTAGGKTFTLRGRYLGPVDTSLPNEIQEAYTMEMLGGYLPLHRVTYGRAPESNQYTAVNCQIVVPHEQLRCSTVPGTGNELDWRVFIGAQTHEGYPEPLPFHTNYHPPIVSYYSGDGADGADTRGGQSVFVHGQMFGPEGEQAIDLVTYTRAESALNSSSEAVKIPPVFTASCELYEPHTILRCETAQGAGKDLIWNVTINGQNSIDPVSRYASPVITGFAGEAAIDARTFGGQRIIVLGKNFGPRDKGLQYLDWVRFGPSAADGVEPSDFEAAHCEVLNHTAIECVTPPGSGGPYYWRASVRGQAGPPSPGWSYRKGELNCKDGHAPRPPPNDDGTQPPNIPSSCENRVSFADDTTGGASIRLVGKNLGLSDPHAQFHVLFGGQEIPVTESFWNNATMPEILVLDPLGLPSEMEPTEVFLFELPAGFGYDIDLTLVTTTSSGTHSAVPLTFSYEIPDASVVMAREDLQAPDQMMYVRIGGMSFCNATEPYAFSSDSTSINHFSTEGYGSPSFAGCGSIWINYVDLDIDTEYESIGLLVQQTKDGWVPLSAPAVISWDDDVVSLHVPRGQGRIKVTVSGQDSQELSFSPQFPAFRESACEDIGDVSYRTAGYDAVKFPPQNLTLQAFDIFGSEVTVTIGGKECTNNTGPINCRDEEVRPGVSQRLCEVTCLIPPGQARDNTIILDRNGMKTDTGSVPCVLHYGPPVIVDVEAEWNTSYPGPDSAIHIPSDTEETYDILIVPTDGALVSLIGDNFGVGAFESIFSPSSPATSSFIEFTPSNAIPRFLASVYASHTLVQVSMPPGEGTGHHLMMNVGEQTIPKPILINYATPVTTSVNPPVGQTQGGERVRISGRNFGTRADRVAVTIGQRACVDVTMPVPHFEIECTTPIGHGVQRDVRVLVAGQESCDFSQGACKTKFDYGVPQLASISLDVWRTHGGEVVALYGSNFGRWKDDLIVTFEPTRISYDLRYTLPDPYADMPQYTHDGEILSLNDSCIVFTTPMGQGSTRNVYVHVAGQSSIQNLTITYGSPDVEEILPLTGPTRGYLAKLEGDNFGHVEGIVTSEATLAPLTEPLLNTNQHVDRRRGTKISDEGLKVSIRKPGGQIADCALLSGSAFDDVYEEWLYRDERGNLPPKPDSPYTHTSAFCQVITGFGQDINTKISLDGIFAPQTFNYSYNKPSLTSMVPSWPDANGHEGAWLMGADFGPTSFGTRQNDPFVHLGDKTCNDPELTSDQRVDCNTRRDVVGPKVVTMTVAGYTNVSYPTIEVQINQNGSLNTNQDGSDVSSNSPERMLQTAPPNSDPPVEWRVEFRCSEGYYGQRGELCLECPRGAVCRGGINGCIRENSTDGTCEVYEEPYAQPGWWSSPVSVNDDKCSGREERPDFVEGCPYMLPCEPVEACSGDNECSTGYTGTRCSKCTPGQYYRRNGLCVECPSNAYMMIIIFICVIVVVALGGYILNKKNFHVAFVSIGVDYFQVLAMFAQARVEWPGFLLELFNALSIFNFSLDITAPACAMPDISYEQQWWATMILPLCVAGLLLLLHIYKYFMQRWIYQWPSKRRNEHVPTLVGVMLLTFYYLYLYLCRTIFEVFNCNPTDPPDDWSPGYMSADFVPCYEPGGMHLRMLPFAIVFAAVYTVGYPLFAVYTLRKNKAKVKTDQLLRALGTGETPNTNRYYSFRRKYHKLYYHFKPGKWYWILLIIARKFGIAITALMFRQTPSFQMAVALVVLFASYALHVHHQPYMSMSARREIILQHLDKVQKGVKMHVRIAEAYAAAQREVATKQHQQRTDMDTMLRKKRQNVSEFIFDYNTVESILLACAVFVALSGVMFQSGRFDSSAFVGQRDALAVVVILVIAASVIYFAAVFVSELTATLGISFQCLKRSAGRASDVTKVLDKPGDAALSYNPMALKAAQDAKDMDIDDVLNSSAPPTRAQWAKIRAHSEGLRDSLQQLRAEVNDLRVQKDKVISGSPRGSKSSKRPSMKLMKSKRPSLSTKKGALLQDDGNTRRSSRTSSMGDAPPKPLTPKARRASQESDCDSKTIDANVAALSNNNGFDAVWGDWTRCKDTEGNQWYYNGRTGESVWEAPEGFDAPGVVLWSDQQQTSTPTRSLNAMNMFRSSHVKGAASRRKGLGGRT